MLLPDLTMLTQEMATTTRALVLRSVKQPLRWENVVLGQLHADELLVNIHATGICHTDVACMNGTLPTRLPQVLGHEGIRFARRSIV